MKKFVALFSKFVFRGKNKNQEKENKQWVKKQLEKTAQLGGKLLLTF